MKQVRFLHSAGKPALKQSDGTDCALGQMIPAAIKSSRV